jgi:hypothetical protein
MGSSLGGPYHSDEIRCPKCGRCGQIKWDGSQFVELTGDFYERLSPQAPYPIELVCKRCGIAQGSTHLRREPPASSPIPRPVFQRKGQP